MSKATFGENLQKGPDHKGETTYVMYHGTTMKASRKIKCKGFIRSADGMLGPGVYVSRSFEKAACYPMGAKGQKRAVVKLSVRVGRVKKIDRQGHHLQKSWHQAGYDTAWVPPNCGMVKSGRQENCVWDPKRIRVLSIQNNTRESSDDESTDEDGDEDDDDDDDDDGDDETDTNSGELTDEDEIAADGVSGEESTDSSAERSSRHSSDTSTDEYVNTDNASQDHADDRSSDHRDDDEASDEEGSRCDERTYDYTETNASESNDGEFSNEYSYESDDDY